MGLGYASESWESMAHRSSWQSLGLASPPPARRAQDSTAHPGFGHAHSGGLGQAPTVKRIDIAVSPGVPKARRLSCRAQTSGDVRLTRARSDKVVHGAKNLAVNRSAQPIQESGSVFAECR